MEFRHLQTFQAIVVMPIGVITPPPPNTVVRNIDKVDLELPVGIATSSDDRIPGLAFDVLVRALINGLKDSIRSDRRHKY